MPDFVSLAAERLREQAPRLPKGARYCLAFSGGGDSTALLLWLQAAGLQPLLALHVDHQLQSASTAWAAHCAAICRSRGVELQTLTVSLPARSAQGPEAAARQARYAALQVAMHPGDVLITAHHQQDQAETLLLRLLRGAGVDGLAAMRPLQPFAPGQLWRPLLDTPQVALRQAVDAAGLQVIDDPHNHDPRYARSWLREHLLPPLRARYPALDKILVRGAAHLAQAAELLDALAESDLRARAVAETLDVHDWPALPVPRRRNLLRAWLHRQGDMAPDTLTLETLEREVITAAASAQPSLRIGTLEVRRYRQRLYLGPRLPAPPAAGHGVSWTTEATLSLPPGCGELNAPAAPPRPLAVCFRPRLTLRPAPGAPSRTLKNLFQEAGMPPWRRARLPCVLLDGALAWVPGVAESADWQTFCRTQNWQPIYQAPSSSTR